jgi:molecular chaperone IbpA
MYYKQGPNQWEVPNPHKIPYSPSPKDEWEKLMPKPPEKAKPLTVSDLFPNLDRWAIGFDPFFSALESAKATKAPSYPPYNVTRSGDVYTIEMALAGLKKSDLEITVKERTLTIATTDKVADKASGKKNSVEVLHQGIASRAFTTNFALGENIEVTDATMADGILTVICTDIIPDEKKPKTITIK